MGRGKPTELNFYLRVLLTLAQVKIRLLFKHLLKPMNCTNRFVNSLVIVILIGSNLVYAQTNSNNSTEWTGFYVSGLAGKTAGNVSWKNGSSDWVMPGGTDYYEYPNASSQSKSGWNGSLKFGYNKALENNLIGIELGATYQDFSGIVTPTSYHQTNVPNDGSIVGFNLKTTINTYQTLALRLGRIFDEKTFFYVFAGGATGQLKNTASQGNQNVPATNWWNANTSASNNQTKLGYVSGLGLEYNYSKDWSLRANYEYVNFGNVSSKYKGEAGGATPIVYATNAVNFQNLSVGLTRRF